VSHCPFSLAYVRISQEKDVCFGVAELLHDSPLEGDRCSDRAWWHGTGVLLDEVNIFTRPMHRISVCIFHGLVPSLLNTHHRGTVAKVTT